MKSTLEVRPIVIFFLAFLLERTLEFRLKENRVNLSPFLIQEAINSLSFTEVKINGREFLIQMRPTEAANKILRILRIAPLKNILPLEEAKEFTW